MNHTPAPWTIADDGTIESRHQGRVGQLKDAGYADTALIQAAIEHGRQLAHQHGLRWYKAGGWDEITDLKTIALLERAPEA